MSAHKTTPFADSWLPLRTCGLKRHEEEAAVRVKDETPFLTHLMDFYRERYISATIFSVADLFHRFKFRILSVLLLFHYYGLQVPTVCFRGYCSGGSSVFIFSFCFHSLRPTKPFGDLFV